MIRDCSWEASGATDDQEGLCEAGVFTLTPAGWSLLSRKRFTQIGIAREWAENEANVLRLVYPQCHWRIITENDSGTLEDVLAVFEATRCSSDVELGELPADDGDIEEEMGEAGLGRAGGCEACVCVEVETDGQRVVLIAARKRLVNRVEALQWAQFAEQELLQCPDVRSCGTLFVQTAATDAVILDEFKKRVVKYHRNS
jgi:hypothetical protein